MRAANATMPVFCAVVLASLAACSHLPGGRAYRMAQESESRAGAVVVKRSERVDAEGAVLITTAYQTGSAADAEMLRRDRIAELLSIYDPHIDPYFAILTKKTTCPEEYSVRRWSAKGVDYFSMFANDRNTLGACTPALAVKRAAWAFLVCGADFYQFEKYVPAAKWTATDDEELRLLGCQR